MREFLTLFKQESSPNTMNQGDDHVHEIVKSMLNWKQRVPSQSFDPIGVWDDIALGRLSFIDQYSFKYQN